MKPKIKKNLFLQGQSKTDHSEAEERQESQDEDDEENDEDDLTPPTHGNIMEM